MKRIAPDDSEMTWRRDKDKKGGNGGGRADMDAFMPGQLKGLARDLSWGFGGGFGNWKKSLRQPYEDTEIVVLGRGGGNGGGKDKAPNGGPVPDQNGGGHTPVRPDHRAALAIQAPAGILAAAMPQQMQGGGGILSQQQMAEATLPPEILAILRAQNGM